MMWEVLLLLAAAVAFLLFMPAKKTNGNRGRKSKTGPARSPKFGPERFAPEMGKLDAADAIWVYQRYIKLHVRSADKETAKDLLQDFKTDMEEHESTLVAMINEAEAALAHYANELVHTSADSDDASERKEAAAIQRRITKLQTKTDMMRDGLEKFQLDRREFTISHAAYAFGRAKSPVATYHDLD
jgi:hypothetical protein